MINILSDTTAFDQIQKDWTLLYSNALNVTFFQTYQYNRIAWETFKTEKDKLYIIIYKNTDIGTGAIFPFYIDKEKCLRFINDRHTDFCNILFSNKICSIHNVMYEVWQEIIKEPLIRFVFLDNLLPTSPILSYWKVFAGNAFVFSQTEHSWLNCPHSNSVIKEFKHLTAKERNRLNNIEKKMATLSMKIFKMPTDPYPQKDITSLITTMERIGLRSHKYFNNKMLLFIQRLYEAGLLEIPILYNKNEAVSLGFIFISPDENYSMRWIILYKEKKYNLWNNLKYITEKSSKKQIIIDFGRGGYDYKMTNFRPEIENLYRLLFSKNAWNNWYVLFKICASHLRKTFKRYKH